MRADSSELRAREYSRAILNLHSHHFSAVARGYSRRRCAGLRGAKRKFWFLGVRIRGSGTARPTDTLPPGRGPALSGRLRLLLTSHRRTIGNEYLPIYCVILQTEKIGRSHTDQTPTRMWARMSSGLLWCGNKQTTTVGKHSSMHRRTATEKPPRRCRSVRDQSR